ncbi:tyrosine-type recombinase/integrase [Paraburkholderia aspalathi]|uniref:tyrosine-type recombinase/integrase n=1 Tax=Paraburkholderia aspalathi TaxID=1324617 RepID=UPI0038B91EB9
MTYRLTLIDPRTLPGLPEHQFGLFFGARVFRLNDRPIVGIVTDEHSNFHWESTDFLADIACRSSSVTGDTVRAYGEGLVAWLNFLDAHALTLEVVTESDLLAFRSFIRARELNHGSPVSAATVRLRLIAVIQFFKWSETTNTLNSPLGEWLLSDDEHRRISDFRSRRRRASLFDSYLPRARVRTPPHISNGELQQILRLLPLPYSLMVKWAVTTGMRRFEICALKLEQIVNSTGTDDGKLVRIEINRKGGNNLPVYVTTNLLDETRWYVRLHRKKPLVAEKDYVFIGKTGCSIKKAALSRNFRVAANASGSRATFHHLRHKYALTVLQQLQRSADAGSAINPLKAVQVLLGHRNIETTSIYLDAMEAENPVVEGALAFLYGSLSSES